MSTGFYHPNSMDPQVVDAEDALDYSLISKAWAIKMDGPVEDSSYSSQWNATLSASKAGEAAGSADDALGYSLQASYWAEQDEDVFVPGTSSYSAMHWALQAQSYVQTLENTYNSITEAGAVLPLVVTDATTARTLTTTDNHTYIRFTNAGAVTVTVPDEASQAFGIGDEIHLRAVTDGTVTIADGAGVTINAPDSGGLVLAEAGATCTLKKVGSDEWDLFGLVSA